MKRTERRFGTILGSILNRKLGVDFYFIAFGIFGIFLIPTYFYFKMKSNKIRRETIDNKYDMNLDVDLDERSFDFIPGDSKALKKTIIKREKTKLKIKELEQELYGY